MATPKAAKAPASQFAPLADELGALTKELAPFAQKLARVEHLKKALRAGCAVPAAEQWTVEGAHFIALLGPCANQRVIDITLLVRKIGASLYATFATCTLKDLETHVTPAIIAAVVTDEPKGSRSLKTFEKGGAQ